MDIVKKLNQVLVHEHNNGQKCIMDTEVYKNIAETYTKTEHSIAVLSDMQLNMSYIYSSSAASELGLSFSGCPMVIDSIWEEEILKKIHPDDKLKKYVHELRFFEFSSATDPEKRSELSVLSRIRMKDKNDTYKFIRHRMFYFFSPYNAKLRFALCLYNIDLDQSKLLQSSFLIINSAKGEIIIEDRLNYTNILSKRELEILKYIGDGYTSKEIAGILSISINTVNRHRQNILERLKVKNSVSAFNESLHYYDKI
ncbi:LuxR family transcriptional regulator [Chryseobacterium shandongense]|jgi:DNA-binding CsgD family transcriptional regulator|uniref:LuxR family transcriptional regulator n=1 Tax=Chryseobacterium shandongense TaxID=1493872 RepID=A0AAD1DKN7_9FLAO|nr:helix-turn-helix transcriptional regulator [Chryseobacterium shandongense]AZA85881.1 LuxR family transcriptional regulator [Chryseobacterium shandongense]AZA94290.1 LuxR family transcriptional regulator [Chryseobacterium shandongense]